MKSYKDLEVWKKSKEIVVKVYSLTSKFPQEELYGITNQIRRATVSASTNITEGHGRNYSKETSQFLHIARGSLFEVETLLILSFEIGYITNEEGEDILNDIADCLKMLNGLIRYLENKKPAPTNPIPNF